MCRMLCMLMVLCLGAALGGCAATIDSTVPDVAIAQKVLLSKRAVELASADRQNVSYPTIEISIKTANAAKGSLTIPLTIPVGVEASVSNEQTITTKFTPGEVQALVSGEQLDKRLNQLSLLKLKYTVRGIPLLGVLGIAPRTGDVKIWDPTKEKFVPATEETVAAVLGGISRETDLVESLSETMRDDSIKMLIMPRP